MSDLFRFSSRGRDADEAFAAYAALYANGAGAEPSGAPFHAEVTGWRFDGILLFDRRVQGVIHRRDQDRVRSDGFDHLVLHAVLEGELVGSAESGFARIGPGEMVLLEAGRPTRTTLDGVHLFTISIARHLVGALADADALHGRIIAPPASLVMIDYLRALARHAAMLEPSRAYSRAFVDLLEGALVPGNPREADRNRLMIRRREAVDRHIDEHLGDPDLSAATIAAATGLSRSALYRLLDKQGGVTRHIQRRRLAAVRAELDGGSTAPFADLADRFGFAAEEHLRRLFASSYGVSPSAYRAELKTSDGARVGFRKWQGWMTELL